MLPWGPISCRKQCLARPASQPCQRWHAWLAGCARHCFRHAFFDLSGPEWIFLRFGAPGTVPGTDGSQDAPGTVSGAHFLTYLDLNGFFAFWCARHCSRHRWLAGCARHCFRHALLSKRSGGHVAPAGTVSGAETRRMRQALFPARVPETVVFIAAVKHCFRRACRKQSLTMFLQ